MNRRTYKDKIQGNILIYIGQGLTGDQKDASKDRKLIDNMNNTFMIQIEKDKEYVLKHYGVLIKHEYLYHKEEERMVNLYTFLLDTESSNI